MRTLSYSLAYIRRDPDMVQAHALEAWLAEHFLEYATQACERDSARVVAHLYWVYEMPLFSMQTVLDAHEEVDRWYNLIDFSRCSQKQAMALGKLCFASVLQILVPQWITG